MVKIIDINFLNTKCAIACFLVESDNGLILIETGPATAYNNIKKALEIAGYNINKINHVFVTHIHLDHSGGAWRFAKNGAKIYVHPNGAKHLIDPGKLIESATKIYGDTMNTLWGKINKIPESSIQTTDHREKIVIGNVTVESLHTPGHANHHIAWKINNDVFTGDVAGAKIKNGPVLPACPPPEIDLDKWCESLNLILEEKPDVLYLTHFGKSTNVYNHISEMKFMLKNWGDWIKENKSSYNSVEKLTEKFNEYVYDFLKNKKKLNKKLIEQYYAANPPYMSVTGLLRYWNKKK